jgi:acetyl esterase
MTASRPVRFIRFLGDAMLGIFALGTLGSFFPAIPVLGELGPVLTAFIGPWIAILSLIGSVLLFRRWRTGHRQRSLVLAGLSAFAALGTGYVLTQQAGVARANGVRVDPVEALLAGSQADDSPHPVKVNYTKYEGEDLPLDIYRPATRPGGKPAPVFVYVHGGGWGGQTLKQREADYRWFAERGYLVISLEYSLSKEKRQTWNVAEPQLACALAWINANAARFGGDRARLALWGESAGGNLVLNLSYRASAGMLISSCEGALPQIRAVMALYPVVDPARMYRPVDPLLGVFGRMMGANYTGGSPEQFPDRYAAIASATHINVKAPPTLLVVPEADHLVAPDAAYAFAAKAKAAGVETRLIRMPYAEHAFDLRSGGIGNQLVRQTMLQFLEAHGLKS